MTDPPCEHRVITTWTSDNATVAMWACAECSRRFYPACSVCVSVGHRNIVHQPAAPAEGLRDAAQALIDATDTLSVWDENHGYAIDSARDELDHDVDRSWDNLRAALEEEQQIYWANHLKGKGKHAAPAEGLDVAAMQAALVAVIESNALDSDDLLWLDKMCRKAIGTDWPYLAAPAEGLDVEHPDCGDRCACYVRGVDDEAEATRD